MTQHHFYLAGGTALAVHLGHRRSVDLDWFTGERIPDPMHLGQQLRDAGLAFVTGQVEPGTLYGTVAGVRVSFLEYRYPLLKPPLTWPEYGCFIASPEDIACMKLSAIAQRGARKDFIDIYALGMHYNLRNLLDLYRQKYSVEDIGHLLYGLAFFDDADREQMPRMLWNANWKVVKKAIRGWLKAAAG